MMWRVPRVCWLAMVFGALSAAAEGPLTVSPGDETGIVSVSGRCPTFLWTLAEGAETVELSLYRVQGEDADSSAEAVLTVALPGSAQGWTPSVDQCLESGARYAWSVRAVAQGAEGSWSEPRLFSVAARPSEEEVRNALETLERYLGGQGEAETSRVPRALETLGPPTGPGAPGPQDSLLRSTTVGIQSAIRGSGGTGTGVYGIGDIGMAGVGAAAGVYGTSGSNTAGSFVGTGSAKALYARSSVCCDGNQQGEHAAWIRNSAGEGGDVLVLSSLASDPTSGTNFVTFHAGFEVIGEIQGDGLGGVEFVGSLASPSSDLAEYLPKLDAADRFEPGEVVGLVGGKVSRQTRGADRAMVISTRPMITGGRPEPEEESRHALVAFLGQVPVRVRGTVVAGDLLIPSGLEDGTAIAVSAEDLTPERARLVVGRSLQDSLEGEEVATVKTLVGLTELSTAGDWGTGGPVTRYSGWLVAAGLVAGLTTIRGRRWLAGSTCRSRT